ncbi:RNA polymerase sigma factor SigJ [Nocardioides sp. zg-1228]|uniref:RNA polymerase sigma factor SigJ n=1 Tax=Nocardioides sp. zg-1228 TaxID=2763008 RepID=UPI0016424961|nr:RNA polymerase sigma factor SigJ [Nocardioides sp. zg-1228]MBC2932883.1 RNA polymerase sigma factor SigJ [Nocardioides sp. zg-1228]QSF56909.1 RNA polymerase sigma factor SigJ [Nocardioides sp. zg-1228]
MTERPDDPEARALPGDSDLADITSERRQLLRLAYRLLGSTADAEDVLQETYVRWYSLAPSAREAVKSPGAWLTTVASRICLDMLGSARARRERYIGEWLPDPLPGHTKALYGPSTTALDPAERVSLDESVHMALLVVLDSLTPAERVSFVLHDVYRYPFAEVAEIVGRTPEACRQLATSARRRIGVARTPPAPTREQSAVIRAFKDAWESHDIQALIGLLDPKATAVADGGGRATAELRPVTGAEKIAQTLVEVAAASPHLTLSEQTVNGQPGLVGLEAGVASTVVAFDIADGAILSLWVMRNPDKLRLWRN